VDFCAQASGTVPLHAESGWVISGDDVGGWQPMSLTWPVRSSHSRPSGMGSPPSFTVGSKRCREVTC
jgi:hypothetical protein